MKRTSILSFCLLVPILAFSISSCKQDEIVSGDALQTRIHTLDNGLKIFMSVNPETPRIQTYIAVKVGSKNDPSETTGLAHYFEHLMFKGSEQFGTVDYAAEKPLLDEIERLFEVYRQTTGEAERRAVYHQIDSVSYEASKLAIPNEYDKLMALIGSNGSNAWTSSDETVYQEDIPANQIDNWARIQADRFRHNVIRGFHTELETVYEEKNMSLTDDSDKLFEALQQSLFPHHPYGQQTTLGSQEHLKNPSITNIKAYHDVYYVPNNIAICVSGDFDPDEMVAAIEKYFGDWEPNPEIPTLQYEPEAPITEPIVRDVYGLEAETVALAWRLPAASDLKTSAVAEIAGSVLSNGQAGLMDLNVNQQQKALYAYGGCQLMPDYGMFLALGSPKQGQTLEELRALLLEEVAKLRSGDFDASLLTATVNNVKLSKMRQLENNSARARAYVNAFIDGIPWKDACKDLERLSAVTKEDVVAFANEYLAENAYVVVYKRQGEDDSVQKISAPKITPIVTNRDKASAFLTEIQQAPVKPIEPVFLDFEKDMSRFTLTPGADVLYKKNEINGLFNMTMIFNRGNQQDPALSLAMDYLSYLGTPTMSAEQIASRMYGLACGFAFNAGDNQTRLRVDGLGENLAEALGIAEDLVRNAVPDEQVLANLKADIIKSRKDAKQSQSSCFQALSDYVTYGPEYVRAGTLSDAELNALTSEQLLAKVRDLFDLGHEILYYGPQSEAQLRETLASTHKVAEGARQLPKAYLRMQQTSGDQVVMAPYDAAQIYYLQFSDRGERYQADQVPVLALFNEYFGGGMNSIVFQEMREARGLAYSAWASLDSPSFVDDTYSFSAFIATQNDKMRQAVDAFSMIINEMPQSEAAFTVARDALLNRLRTSRTTGFNVLTSYISCRDRGLTEPTSRVIFEQCQTLTLADVVAAQERWAKDRNYTYAILGDSDDLDMKFISTLGPVRRVSLEEIFGY
ncbi:MAG: insulinase family protein [Bacteroidales bacterium]|nr:insulinase family protein [Bacteroidales bacterium]